MNPTCGCCEGTHALTPVSIANRPGLAALAYRIGTHASFLETMKARLSSLYLDIQPLELDATGKPAPLLRPLQALTARDAGDVAIALLDAWAVVADVLTFYQERIANEGYLRTATERRSVQELARLIGYTLRPGVAASVFLAYELDKDSQVVIPVGSRAQSIPNPGETMQSFETSDPLEARTAWNDIKPRMSRRPVIRPDTNTLYFEGTTTNLKPNDPLLLVFKDGDVKQILRRVHSVEPDFEAKRTKVELQIFKPNAFITALTLQAIVDRYRKFELYGITEPNQQAAAKKALEEIQKSLSEVTAATPLEIVSGIVLKQARILRALDLSPSALTAAGEEANLRRDPPSEESIRAWVGEVAATLEDFARLEVPADGAAPAPVPTTDLTRLLAPLQLPRALPPSSAVRLNRTVQDLFSAGGSRDAYPDLSPKILTLFHPDLKQSLYAAWGAANINEPSPVKVYALRVSAPLFGHNAPKEPKYIGGDGSTRGNLKPQSEWPEWDIDPKENPDRLYLDSAYEKILPKTYVVIQKPGEAPIYKINDGVVVESRNAYGISARTTRIILPPDAKDGHGWWSPHRSQNGIPDATFDIIRRTTVFAQPDELTVVDEPICKAVCGNTIELGGLYDGLKSGRWIIVSGERTDVSGTSGVKDSELVMLARVDQAADPALPGDKIHTTLTLADTGLNYCYKRSTVSIYANVVKATHGETRSEVLGSGDGSKAFQMFGLRQFPLTYLAAPTAAGAESTLNLYVNDVRWHETDGLSELAPTEHRYITRTDDDQKTSVIFGDGRHGARPPTGQENVKAVYRSGIGKPGNVKAEQISLLATRPLGVKGVRNPRGASGGADREDRDQARRNAPLAVTALDRLVSVQDYEDFTRTFAGIGKASARRVPGGARQLVHVTIAGADDIPIETSSDLYRNLRLALRDNGDPYQPFEVAIRELVLLIISAGVRIDPDYQWPKVEPKIRAALLDQFGFNRRDLGQHVLLSDAIAAIQAVAGVVYVDVEKFATVDEALLVDKLKDLGDKLKLNPRIPIGPDQLAILTPEIQDTLILKELTA